MYLESHHVFAELTVAGLYTGVHRYTFENPRAKKYILFDVTHSVQEVCMDMSRLLVDISSAESHSKRISLYFQ